MQRQYALLSVLLAVAQAAPVHAQVAGDPQGESSFEARARVAAGVAATNREDATASGTEIDVRERTRALEDVGDALVEVPGVHVQDTGALGSFSAVALRGAEAGHTSVLLGAVPLSSADTGAFDLSVLPLSVLDAIEVYRGGAPVFYSEGAIGGVLRLLPRTAQQNALRATLGYGSFGRLSLSATSSVVRADGLRPALFAHVGLLRGGNDYAYVDDAGTRFDDSDDRVLQQRNADIHAGDGLLHAGVDALGGRVELVLAGHGRSDGIPGPLAAPTLQVRRQLVRMLAAASYERELLDSDGERRYRVQLVGSSSLQRNRVSDLEGELGISDASASDDSWVRGYLRAAGSVRVLPFLEPTVVASFTRDDFQPRDPLAFSLPPRPSGRSTEAIALEARLYGRLGDTFVELRPSARLAFSQTAIKGETLNTPDRGGDDVSTTYRVAALIAPWPALAFSASAATGVRLPSILELFGDRVYQLPNPALVPERSKTADASVVLRGRLGALRGSAELRGFALFIDDLIRYERTAQFTARPENIASGRILGLEFGLQGTYGRHLSLVSSLTALATRNQFGKALPFRPPLQLLVRPEVVLYPPFADRAALFAELEHVAFTYLDEANRTFLDGRSLLGVGGALSLLDDRVVVQARVANLLDDLATDVLSHPLPGREFLLSLTMQQDD